MSLILWGGCAALTGMVSNIPSLMVIRFVLGVVEAAVMPAMLIFIANWFTKSERSRANTFLILGNPVTVLWMSVVSGLSGAFLRLAAHVHCRRRAGDHLGGDLVVHRAGQAGSRRSGSPQQEKSDLDATLRAEQAAIKPVKNYGEAFRSPAVIKLCAQYFCWSIGVYGFVLWLPSILKNGSSFGMVETGWLSAVPYLAATIAMLAASWASDKLQPPQAFVWPFLLIGAVAFAGSYLLGSTNFWASYALLVIAGAAMYAPYGPFFAIVPELLPKNVAGGAMALINSMGALGSFVGSYVVGYLNGATGSPGASYVFMSVALVAAVMLTLAVKPQPGAAQGGEACRTVGWGWRLSRVLCTPFDAPGLHERIQWLEPRPTVATVEQRTEMSQSEGMKKIVAYKPLPADVLAYLARTRRSPDRRPARPRRLRGSTERPPMPRSARA